MLFLRLNAICREENTDPAGGGGAGGGGGGTGDGSIAGFTKEQVGALATIVNQAITAHNKRQPAFEESLKSVKWGELLAPVIKELVPSQETSGTGGKGSGAKEPTELEKQIIKIQADFEAERKLRVDAEQARAAAENARREDGAKGKLRSLLNGKVNDGAVDHAVNHLTLVQKRLSFDEQGNPLIKVKRAAYAGFPPEEVEVSLEDGIKDILEEADMKVFLPVPKGSGGSPGPRSSGGQLTSASFQGEAKTDAERLQRAAIREKELLAKYGNG